MRVVSFTVGKLVQHVKMTPVCAFDYVLYEAEPQLGSKSCSAGVHTTSGGQGPKASDSKAIVAAQLRDSVRSCSMNTLIYPGLRTFQSCSNSPSPRRTKASIRELSTSG